MILLSGIIGFGGVCVLLQVCGVVSQAGLGIKNLCCRQDFSNACFHGNYSMCGELVENPRQAICKYLFASAPLFGGCALHVSRFFLCLRVCCRTKEKLTEQALL